MGSDVHGNVWIEKHSSIQLLLRLRDHRYDCCSPVMSVINISETSLSSLTTKQKPVASHIMLMLKRFRTVTLTKMNFSASCKVRGRNSPCWRPSRPSPDGLNYWWNTFLWMVLAASRVWCNIYGVIFAWNRRKQNMCNAFRNRPVALWLYDHKRSEYIQEAARSAWVLIGSWHNESLVLQKFLPSCCFSTAWV